MATYIHFINVGQGNMVLIQATNNKNIMFDCNITNDNEKTVLSYVKTVIGNSDIDVFICSHRDADHMRGIDKLHGQNTIRIIRDSGYPGTTTNSPEYKTYLKLRNDIGNSIIKKCKYIDYSKTRLNFLSAQDTRLASNANAQGIVIKVDHINGDKIGSALLTADSDAQTWKDGIMIDYTSSELKSDILMGGHHGSITFFDHPDDSENYFTNHIKNIDPDMTIISVGDNSHGHPDKKAIDLYKKYSNGSSKGNKVARTDTHGTIVLELKDSGGWSLKYI